jgi:nitronate monooxygenase
MPITTSVTEKFGIEHPVMLAAMDLVADARLTAAVSEAGGFGFLGAGYGDEGWLRREIAALQGMRARHRGKFGIGFITWSLAKQPHLLDIALEAKPAAIWLSFGDPAPFAARIKAAGALVVCQVQTVGMAEDAVAKGADILVAQGTEAGGHGVAQGTMTLVPAVADAVGDKVPVLAAGGIADGRGLAAALMLGASGVVLGTRFYAAREAAGFDAAKRRIIDATGDETLRGIVFDISRRNVWPAPFTGRCLLNDHLRRWAGRELDLMRAMDVEGERYAVAREAGDFDIAAVIAGESAGLIHDIPAAAEIVRRMVDEASALLAGPNRLAAGATRASRAL